MSQVRSEKIQCKERGEPIKVQMRSSINFTLDSGLKRQLLDGLLTETFCSKCGTEHNVVDHTLIHDTERNYMIAYSGEEEESNSQATGLEQPIEKMLLTHRFFRRAYSWLQMREKVVMFRDGLYDIIVELMKTTVMLHKFDMKVPEHGMLWYRGTKEEDDSKVMVSEVWRSGEYSGDMEVPVEIYDHYWAEYGEPADLYLSGTFTVVNQRTMLGIIDELRGAVRHPITKQRDDVRRIDTRLT